MSVSAVNFKSSTGYSQLKGNGSVSFAGRREDAPKAENTKSNKGAYIAAGAGIAAAVAAAVVFRKPIGNFVKSLKLPSMQNIKVAAYDVMKGLKGGFEKSVNFVKTKGADAVKTLKDKFKNFNVNNNVAGAFSNVKTKAVEIAKFAWGKVVEGAKFVKDFAVSLWQKAVAFFNKAAHKA